MASRSSRQRHLHSHCFSPRRASGRLHSRRRPPGAPRQPRSRRHYRHKRLSGTAADLPSRLRTEPVVAAHRTRPVTRPPRALTTRRWCPEAAAARTDGARDSARRPGPTAGPPRGSRVPPLRRRAGLRGRPLAPRRCPTWLGAAGGRRGPPGVPSPPLGAGAHPGGSPTAWLSARSSALPGSFRGPLGKVWDISSRQLEPITSAARFRDSLWRQAPSLWQSVQFPECFRRGTRRAASALTALPLNTG